jgi:hypothetical protein
MRAERAMVLAGIAADPAHWKRALQSLFQLKDEPEGNEG